MDETWAHHFTPESKQQSMQWRHSGSPSPKKAKAVPSAGKVMVSVFWDSEGVLLLDFLNKGQTITGDYYANLAKQLREAIEEKRRGKLSRKIFYHQDNAPSHRSLQAMATIYDSGFELLPHAPYSPDIAPSDFNLFTHLKRSLSGIHFRSDEEGFVSAVSSDMMRKSIVFDSKTPKVFYCMEDLPTGMSNKMYVKARPFEKLCEFNGKGLPSDYHSDCFNDIDESEYACAEKERILVSKLSSFYNNSLSYPKLSKYLKAAYI
ncbi:hypothetical protein LAZ67_X000979 [Cordylochernes scorpioides]|uniref:Mariner Mos1 transposase n=1 Tax=Cordylochernes scorpioides TaxID=51811 RepID=A0ABY6LSI8_9ARAC|nr:hypothetical protein LAZ67_X000979 [Cordylochernes scorpioides]